MEVAVAVEVVEENNRKVFVVVPAERRAGRSTLSWALGHLCGGATTVVVTHVHVQPQMIPVMGAKFHASKLSSEQVSSFRRMERDKADRMLDDYVHQCRKTKVRCEKLVVEKEDVASGLVELIGLRGITELVVSAAADRQYSTKLDRPVCRTAAAIMQRADPSCKIWFVCKEQLICTRETKVQIAPSAVTAPLLPNPSREVLHLSTHQEEDDDDIEVELGFYDELREACRAAEDLMNRALNESHRRQKADEEVASCLQKAKEHEELYLAEVKKREELEAALARAEKEISELRQASQQNTTEEATATISALGLQSTTKEEPEAAPWHCQCQCQSKLAASSPSSVIPWSPRADEDGLTCEAGVVGCCWLDGMPSPEGVAQPLARPSFGLRAAVQEYMRQQSQQRCPFP
ncbi:U-box domain-containing protein 36-like [Hordeum vulgare]|uniref:RING-type E3 ubiquitin transferase n=1 Tax=Hordeum vulgare subsp. vulgare TaxID=112509 RepID=A0A8I6WQB4_HORVV|nr:U-box domain-containing protein 33-like [Hordeum vulgare subsp. vulgare]KAE8786650.1 U-box domain-containing protein 36-like [Hordeum vulgare]